ncbi:MAG: M20/M25/M40 family metallo-hydrolase, partial [Bryobacteraceae bacterium]
MNYARVLTRKASRLALLLAATLLAAADISPDRYLEHVKFLASPELEGRGTGTTGLEKAAHYIAGQFQNFGLKPLAGSSYLQAFPVTINARLGEGNTFTYSLNGETARLKLNEEFVPLNFSAGGTATGRLVFAGYGITAPEYNYDDYAGLDVKGKLVVVLRHEPQESDENSPFAGKLLTSHAQLWSKAINAKQRGAAGVILVHDRRNHPGEAEELEKFGRTAGPSEAGILFVQVRSQIVESWLEAAGKKLEEIQAGIDRDLKPRSFELPASLHVSVTTDLRREVKTVHNVAGYLPGETEEYIIIGAHYDHLGLGEQFSLAPSEAGKVHPGADDNASGVAGVLELARWLASMPKRKRGVLFLCFAGEEIGLLGSRFWVDHPLLPLDNALAMINLDMIGRVREGKVYVGGVTSGTNLRELVTQVLPRHSLAAELSGSFDAG